MLYSGSSLPCGLQRTPATWWPCSRQWYNPRTDGFWETPGGVPRGSPRRDPSRHSDHRASNSSGGLQAYARPAPRLPATGVPQHTVPEGAVVTGPPKPEGQRGGALPGIARMPIHRRFILRPKFMIPARTGEDQRPGNGPGRSIPSTACGDWSGFLPDQRSPTHCMPAHAIVHTPDPPAGRPRSGATFAGRPTRVAPLRPRAEGGRTTGY